MKHGNNYCHKACDEYLIKIEKQYQNKEIELWQKKLFRRTTLVLKEVAEQNKLTWHLFTFLPDQLNVDIDKIRENFINRLQNKNISKARLDFYRYITRHFFLFTKISNLKDLREFNNENALAVSKYFTDKCCKNSLSTVLPTLREWYEWLYNNNYVKHNFSLLILKTSYIKTSIPSYLSESDEIKLRQYLDTISYRDKAMVLLALDLGLRSIDIVNLCFDNIDWNKETLTIVQHKTGEIVTHPLLEEIGNAIFKYLQKERPKINNPKNNQIIFLGKNAPYMQLTDTYTLVSKILLKLNIKPLGSGAIGTHTLRYTLVHRLLESSKVPHQTVTRILGHKTNNSDNTYYSVEDSKLKECALSLSEIGSFDWEDQL